MKNKLLICIILIAVILLGAYFAFTSGINKDLEYGQHTTILVTMNQESNLSDLEEIVKNTLDGEYSVSYTDKFSDTVIIRVKDITEEQLKELKDRLNEKYGFEDVSESISVINTPKVEIYDLAKDYVSPAIISYLIVIAYLAVSFRKLGLMQALVEPALTIILVNSLYISIIAICRIPVSIYTLPIEVLVYVLSIIGVTAYLNTKKSSISTEKN